MSGKGQRVGYARVSTIDQNADRQWEVLDCDRIFTDRVSGKSVDRPALQEQRQDWPRLVWRMDHDLSVWACRDTRPRGPSRGLEHTGPAAPPTDRTEAPDLRSQTDRLRV
jgi:hypothetical protein